MNKAKIKGSALLFILGMLFIVILLANVILRIMLNQSRLGKHRTWRTQALYAAQAAMVLTNQQLYDKGWLYNSKHCVNACHDISFGGIVDANDNDLDMNISIDIRALGSGPDGTARIDIIVSPRQQFVF